MNQQLLRYRFADMKNPRNGNPPLSIREKLDFIRHTPAVFTSWLLFAIAVALIGWGVVFANLQETRKTAEQHALLETAALARTHADRLIRSINAIDQITHHIRVEWALTGGKLLLEQIKEEGTFPPPSIYFVTLVDRDGMPFSSTLPNFQPVYLGDRHYFLNQKYAESDELNIDQPILARLSGTNTVHFSRRLTAPDKTFAGIVMVSVPIDFFTRNYDAIVLGKNGLLGVADENDAFHIVRIGEQMLPPETSAFVSAPDLAAENGSFLLDGKKWFKDHRGRFVGWQHLKGYPLIALVGMDEMDTLAEYREGRHSAIQYAAVATLALAILTAIAIALTAELAWRKHRLSMTQATYRLATEEGSEGFYIIQPVSDRQGVIADFRVIDCNEQGAGFFNLRRDELIGKAVSVFKNKIDIEPFINRLRRALDQGIYESEIDVPAGSPLRLDWVHVKIIPSAGNLAVRLRDISEAKAHVHELRRRGDEDVLTSLPNRHWIQGYLPEAIQRAKEAHESLALLFIDLDGFKKVNDTAGHAAGDELLQHAAQRLREAIRPHDKVVRFGGDEFVVIVEDIEHRIDAAHVAERVQHAFSQPFRLGQGTHSVGTSIGIALFPTDAQDAAALLERADIAMYSVKTNGKHGYQFYESKFYRALRDRLDKEAELRDAITRDEFVMYYQPRVDIVTGLTLSLEALVRWQHPSKGLLEPREFIAIAEESGLIVGIGGLVIDKVCAQLASWAKRGTELVPVSINVSPRQFGNADVADLLVSALARHNVSASLVELEITESSVMAEGTVVSMMLASLQKKGVKILVDDFGTGYSSLSQLQRLDFDVLKVDQSFTASLDKSDESKVFFTAIVTMAHALGMRVVAEGVETLAQIRILKSLGCDEIQGFYISKPLPPGEKQPILPKWTFPVA
jgi:diguanylate cyclase (GGDEF)-like protein